MEEQQVTPLTAQEREGVAREVIAWRNEMREVHLRWRALQRQFPGLGSEQMFILIGNGLYTAVENAEGLADYIRMATSEDWKTAP